MKFLIVALIVVAVALAVPSTELLSSKWIAFKAKHGKKYSSLQEELEKLETFENNLKTIEEHNKLYEAGKSTFKMGVNQFADMTTEEFKAFVGKFKPQKPKSNLVFQARNDQVIPDAIDWRHSGILTPVKDQKACGSCWAFSATGSLEAAYATATGNLVSLSEQQLVDCSSDYGNNGCGGGYMDQAFDYIKDNGIVSEEDYAYYAYTLQCQPTNDSQIVTKITGYVDVAKGEDNLLAAVAERPISVAIDAQHSLQLYNEGIYNAPCGNSDDDLNHGVLAVGYGTEDGIDYWIVKNSWGKSWGEIGYFRMIRNINHCGISNMASYPIV